MYITNTVHPHVGFGILIVLTSWLLSEDLCVVQGRVCVCVSACFIYACTIHNRGSSTATWPTFGLLLDFEMCTFVSDEISQKSSNLYVFLHAYVCCEWALTYLETYNLVRLVLLKISGAHYWRCCFHCKTNQIIAKTGEIWKSWQPMRS